MVRWVDWAAFQVRQPKEWTGLGNKMKIKVKKTKKKSFTTVVQLDNHGDRVSSLVKWWNWGFHTLVMHCLLVAIYNITSHGQWDVYVIYPRQIVTRMRHMSVAPELRGVYLFYWNYRDLCTHSGVCIFDQISMPYYTIKYRGVHFIIMNVVW